jgi:hypothetical protein
MRGWCEDGRGRLPGSLPPAAPAAGRLPRSALAPCACEGRFWLGDKFGGELGQGILGHRSSASSGQVRGQDCRAGEAVQAQPACLPLQVYGPIVDWAQEKMGAELHITDSIFGAELSEEAVQGVRSFLQGELAHWHLVQGSHGCGSGMCRACSPGGAAVCSPACVCPALWFFSLPWGTQWKI